MIDYQGEKFKEFLSKQKISVIKAAEILGVARNTVYQYFRSDNLTREVVTNIITKFNTSEEVVFGRKGQAVVRPIHQNARDLGDFTIYDEDGLNKFVEISPGRYRMGVELVPVYAQAGYLSGYMDQEYLEELPKHYITVDKFVKGN